MSSATRIRSKQEGITDSIRVKYLAKIDFSWLFLLSGLVLTISAIVLPARLDLQVLKDKQYVIQSDLDELEYQIEVYQAFLTELHEGDPVLRQRIFEMQFNLQSPGIPVVIDSSASQTPLEWVKQRARRHRELYLPEEQSSILTGLSHGRSRLFLVGIGAIAMFIGFVNNTPASNQSDSP